MKKSEEDPICGMAVDPIQARKNGLFVTKKGKTSYFCSKECMNKFNGKGGPSTEIILSILLVLVAIAVFFTGNMLLFMGIVFLILSSLKLIDVKGFSNMFVQYDLIAKRSKAYAYTYPFIELALAILFLSKFQVKIAAAVTVIIMGVGAIGIGKNLFSKNKVRCACLGAKIKVPLTRFTLVEDIVMTIMGLMILFL